MMMGDMGDAFNAMREWDKERRERNLENAYSQGTDGWTVHCSTHWSRDLNGSRLDYWPSRNKWRWKGKNHHGDVDGFIRNRTAKAIEAGTAETGTGSVHESASA